MTTRSDQSLEKCWVCTIWGTERLELRGKMHTCIVPVSTADQRSLLGREWQQVAENLRLVDDDSIQAAKACLDPVVTSQAGGHDRSADIRNM